MAKQSFFSNIMNFLRNFMMGRYGIDRLSIALFFVSMAFSMLARGTGGLVFFILGNAGLIICIFRTYSRNIYKRQRENMWFSEKWAALSEKYRTWRMKFAERRIYKYFSCPQCRASLRIPRGKGKVKVTCAKCGGSFIGNSGKK